MENIFFLRKIKYSILRVSFIVCSSTFGLIAQIPPNYYDDAHGYSGEVLKSKLNAIISNHTMFPYTSSNTTDVWDILKQTDKDPQNGDNVILLYTGWSVNAAQQYNNGQGWNREHVWALSRGQLNTNPGPGTDIHALRACNIEVNNARANRWFGDGGTEYVANEGPTANYYDNSNWSWEPRQDIKGDIARMLFYMVTRYEGQNGEPDLELVDYFPSQNNNNPIHARLSDLLQWHLNDPVDELEQNRNDLIYYQYQHNRNPFIDHPEWVEYIWGEYANTSEIDAPKKELIKVIDLLGREVQVKNKLEPLIYIYSDGTIEKRMLHSIK